MDNADSPVSRVSSQGPDLVASDQPIPQPLFPRPLISTLGWDIKSILASSPNFRAVQRVHYTSPNARVEVIIPEVERDGNPLIITGWNRHPRWPKALFNTEWLKKHGDQNLTVRNIYNWADSKISMDDFIKKLRETSAYASADEDERLYGKDIECPPAWTNWLTHSGAIPNDLLFNGSNDFLKFLPDEAKVQTLMCYMGIGDTFTPFHKDLCASSGQNLMCFSEHSGSAIWFMTKSSAAPSVATYFHQLGQEVDLETHVVTIEELAKAPFDVYIAEQRLGDLVLVPPRSCHQVVNKGGITIKTSWSRMSLNGLQTALWHELPIYHRVCRQEIYKVKSNIFHALQHFTRLTEDLPQHPETESSSTSLENLNQLVSLFDDVLAAEVSISRDSMPHVSQSDACHTDNLHCDFCGADIFQSFFECDSCLPASSSGASAGVLPLGDGLVLCPLCYVEGRTCQCGIMQPVQCRPFSDLLGTRDRAVRAIQRVDNDHIDAHGYLSEHPLRLLSGRHANIFEAACKLFQKRQHDNKAVRSCRVLRLPHQVPASAAIYCKSCHSSKCYTHLLGLDSVHSVDALILSGRYDGDANWHQSHRSGSQQYQEIRQRIIQDEESGSRPNASHRLIYLAKTFTTCKAIAVEVTKHGWYDRFAQTTAIPIAKSTAKALVGLPEYFEGDEPHDTHTSNSSSSKLAVRAPEDCDYQTTDSHRTSTPSGGMNEAQSPRQSSLPATPDSRSRIVDATSPSPKSGTLRVLGSPTGAINETHNIPNSVPSSTPCSPLHARQPPVAASLSSAIVDDPGNLSDLTDLTTDIDSPIRSSITAIPVPETPQRPSMQLSRSPQSGSGTSPDTQAQLKSRLVFDCVEIPQPEWYSGGREKKTSREKRKRITGPFPSDTVGSPDFDNPSSAAHEMSNRSLSKRKRKMSPGPASRLQRASKRTHSFLDDRDRPPPNNFLANALNQTFQSNSTIAPSNVPSTPCSFDAIPPVSSPVISSTVKPQYRDIGVQKGFNFTKDPHLAHRTLTTQSSEDVSSCIIRLEAQNRDLRAQSESYKRECEVHRESLDEINRWYRSWGSHHHPLPRPPQPPLSGPSNPFPPQEFSTHPKWRTRSMLTDNRFQTMQGLEPDYPPIETLPLPTPSFSESVSPADRRRTPAEPRGFRMRGHNQGSQVQPYPSAQRRVQRRGPPDLTNGRKQRERDRNKDRDRDRDRELWSRSGGAPPSLGRSGRIVRSPAPLATVQAENSSTSPRADAPTVQHHDQVNQMPPSPPTTVSDHAQLPKSPVP